MIITRRLILDRQDWNVKTHVEEIVIDVKSYSELALVYSENE